MNGQTLQTALDRYVLDGGPLMVALIPCSILAVVFVVRGLLNLRATAIMPPAVVDRLRATPAAERAAAIEAAAEETPCALTRLLSRILQRARQGRYHDEETLSELVSEEIAALYQRNNQLAVIYTVSPLLGLLGTVLGMMTTFFEFSQSANPAVSELAIGFNQALVTTMWGLGVAVPAYVFLSVFRNRLYRFEQDQLPALAQELVAPALSDTE